MRIRGEATIITWMDDSVIPMPSPLPVPSPQGGTEATAGGSSSLLCKPDCFSAYICCPQKPLELFIPSLCCLPLHFKYIPRLHQNAASFLPSSPGPCRYQAQADGQRDHSPLAPPCPPRERWQQHRAEEHDTLAPRCLLHRNSGICQQLQLGITPPAVCFLAQELKSVF